MPEQLARETAKKVGRMTTNVNRKAVVQATLDTATVQHKAAVEDNKALVAKATRTVTQQGLLMLGFSRLLPAILSAGSMAATSTYS